MINADLRSWDGVEDNFYFTEYISSRDLKYGTWFLSSLIHVLDHFNNHIKILKLTKYVRNLNYILKFSLNINISRVKI